MSLNLFNKYRPLHFVDVVGQEKTIKELYQRARDNNFPQCTYITGETGVGKTVISRIIAKNILCTNRTDYLCCNECKECVAIDNETHLLNYFEINASNCGIDHVREIEENASRKIGFSSSSYKVFYIDELQEMATKNKAATNNLLKLIEKPSKNNFFILGSMNDYVVPRAVRDRCTTYILRLINPDVIFERLVHICKGEGIDITNDEIDVLNCITTNSDGSLRKAISLLERVIYSELWTKESVLKELNLISESALITNVNGLLDGDIKIIDYSICNIDVIDRIKSKLLVVYKALQNGFVNKWDATDLKKITPKGNTAKVEYTLETLNELLKYTYTTPKLIEFYLIKIIVHNKSVLREKRR